MRQTDGLEGSETMTPKVTEPTPEETARIVIQIPTSAITPQFLKQELDSVIPTAPTKGKAKAVLTGQEIQPIISPMKSLQQIEEENLKALREGIKASLKTSVGHPGAGPSGSTPIRPTKNPSPESSRQEPIYIPPPSDFPVTRWNMLAKVADRDIRPRKTFDLPSDKETLDLPLSPNAILYEIFPPMDPHAAISEQIPNERKRLIDTNRRHAKPEHVVWSNSCTEAIPRYSTKRVTKQSLTQVTTKEFLPVLEIERVNGTKETVTGADYPLMNPPDIINIINHFQDKTERDHRAKIVFDFSYWFLDYYLTEMGRVDAELYRHFSTFNIPENPNTYFDDPELGSRARFHLFCERQIRKGILPS